MCGILGVYPHCWEGPMTIKHYTLLYATTLLIVSTVCCCLGGSQSRCPSDAMGIRYAASSTGGSITVTYDTSNGQEHQTVDSPWHSVATVCQGDVVLIFVESSDDADVTCTIFVNDVAVDTEIGTGSTNCAWSVPD